MACGMWHGKGYTALVRPINEPLPPHKLKTSSITSPGVGGDYKLIYALGGDKPIYIRPSIANPLAGWMGRLKRGLGDVMIQQATSAYIINVISQFKNLSIAQGKFSRLNESDTAYSVIV